MMDSKWRRLAPVGLYLALISAVVGIGFYIVQRQWNIYLQICIALTVVGLAVFVLLDPQTTQRALTGRQAKYGGNAVIVMLGVFGIVVVVNYFVYQNNKSWDLTETKSNSIAKETLDVLKELNTNIDVKAFYTSRTSSDSTRLLLQRYAIASKGKFSYQFVDPEKDPVQTNQYSVTQDGTVVLVSGARQEKVTIVDEQEITQSLVRLLSTGTKNVYFLTGHGEKSPDDTGETSLSTLKSKLTGKNFNIKTFQLIETGRVPEDANVVVVAGPQKPLSENEAAELLMFAANGGSLVVLEDPILFTQFGNSQDFLADELAKVWGIKLGNDVIVDLIANQYFGNYTWAVGVEFTNHPLITDQVKKLNTVFPLARSVTTAQVDPAISTVEVIKTSANAWAETDLTGIQSGAEPAPDQNTDLVGNVSLVAVAENASTNGRVVVVGNSSFIDNTYIDGYGNADLGVNILDWAAGQENLINLTAVNPTTRTLKLPALPYIDGLLYLAVIVLALIPLGMGIAVFVIRRRRL